MLEESHLLALSLGPSKIAKTITLATGSSVSSLIDLKVPHYGGSFAYEATDSQAADVFSRRLFLWRVIDENLDIEERSFTSDFVDNSIRFHFKNDVIMNGVTMAATGDRIYLLVPTFSVAQRICIPYHSSVGKPSRLSISDMEISFNASGSLFPVSALMSLTASDLSNPKNCYSLNMGTGSATPHTAASALSSSEEALFAFGLTDGSILLITMAAFDEDGPVTQEIFSQTSSVRRLLTGFMSPFSRSDTLAPTTPTSLAFQVSSDDVLLYATGFDQKLRCWSCRQKDLVSSMDIAPQNASRPPVVNYVDGDKWRIKAARDHESPFMILFTCQEGVSQFAILCFTKHGRQKSLIKVMEFEPSLEADLLDFELSERALYTLWAQNGTTILQWKELNLSSLEQLHHTQWHSEALSTDYVHFQDTDFDSPDAVVAAVFDSRAFCFDVVVKAIKMCSKNAAPLSSTSNWSHLKKDLEQYLEKLTIADASSSSFSRATAGSRSKFLRSLWSCCLQYDQECKKPLALLHCPNSGLYGIILMKKIAILSNVTSTISELLVDAKGITPALKTSVSKCFSKLCELYLSVPYLEKVFDAKVFDHSQSAWVTIQEQLREAVHLRDSTDAQRSLSVAEPGLRRALKSILKYLDRSENILSGSTPSARGNEGLTFDVHAAFRSDFGASYLSTAVDKALRERYDLAKASLLLIACCSHFKYKLKITPSTWSFIDGQCIPKLLELLQFYAVLRWLCSLPVGAMEGHKCTDGKNFLLDYMINHPVSDKVRNYWKRFCKNYSGDTSSQSEMNLVVQATIDAFWPSKYFVAFFEYLVITEQYDCLLELCDRIDPNCKELKFSRIFAQAYALMQLGFPEEALTRFRLAYEGIERGDPLLISQLSLATGVDDRMPLTGMYFLKVAELYEKKGMSNFAIKTCENFVESSGSLDATALPILSLMFKHYLRLKQHDDAFATIRKMDSDRNTQAACLRQFVYNLQEENLLGKLNEYDLGDLENEFLAIVESRARAVDLTVENYYEFLYAYFVSRSNYQKAARFLYEMATRFRKEVGGLDALRRQVYALAASLHTLSLEKDGAWIERPDLEVDKLFENAGASPKRASDGEEKEYIPSAQSKRISKKEIENEYVLAKSCLALAERGSTSGALLPPNELVKSLVQYNLFDLAVEVSTIYDLALADIIDCLALRCVQSEKPRSATGLDNECWTWLNENKSICTVVSDSRSQKFAWSLLHSYLQHLPKITPASPLYAAATRRFLSLSQPLPPWLVEEFKKIDFPELLRLLIEYDLLVEAQQLLCEYIDAALGIGTEDFNLTETLVVGKRTPVWLPYSSIDWLLSILAEQRNDLNSIRLRNELEEKLKYYFNQLDMHMQSARKK